MATTQEYFGKGRPPNLIKDPRLMPIYPGVYNLRMPTSGTAMSTSAPSAYNTNFWSPFTSAGTNLNTTSGSWVDMINISSSSYPIAVSFVMGPQASSSICYMRFTVDGTVYTLDTKRAASYHHCWGNLDHSANTYGGSSTNMGGSARFGWSTAGNYGSGSDGYSSGEYASPGGVMEAITRGMPVLYAEHSMRVEMAQGGTSGWPNMGGYRGVLWKYLGK